LNQKLTGTSWCDVQQSTAADAHIHPILEEPSPTIRMHGSFDESSRRVIAIESATPTKKEPKDTRILIVDDSFICQKLLTRGLTKKKYQTETAANGKEACEMLKSVPCLYDAVLMDLRMPVMDGIKATAFCRDKLNLKLPIIVVSADLESAVKHAAMKAGATAFLAKPAKISKIVDILKSLL
jgi:CheY-like chemotaxis protein